MNTETKHTPGLLSLKDSHPTHPGIEIVLRAGETIIGTMTNCLTRPSVTEANAWRVSACWNACLDMADPEKELAQLKAENKQFLFFTERVARSACLQQLSGKRCICFSCLARALIAKHSSP